MGKLYFLFFLLVVLVSCSEDENSGGISGEELYSLLNDSDFIYYNEIALQGKGAHVNYIKIRFNTIAAAALDEKGGLPVGESFPEGSLIVKEVMSTSEGEPFLYAIMLKKLQDANANEGWVWAETKPDGSVVYDPGEKGGACVSCHQIQPHRDFVLVFDRH